MKVFFLSLYAVLRYMGEFVEDGYVQSARAVQLADETGDPELRVNARMPLALQACDASRTPFAKRPPWLKR